MIQTPSKVVEELIKPYGKKIEDFLYPIFKSYFQKGSAEIGYDIGFIIGDIIMEIAITAAVSAATAGTGGVAIIISKLAKYAKAIMAQGGKFLTLVGNKLAPAFRANPKKCFFPGFGCFVRDTPVLVANKNYNVSSNPVGTDM